MATVRMPSSWEDRKTRMAISLRLATSSLRMRPGGAAASSGMVDLSSRAGDAGERQYPRERTGGLPGGRNCRTGNASDTACFSRYHMRVPPTASAGSAMLGLRVHDGVRHCDGLTRREMLRAGAIGLGSLSLPNLFRIQEASASSTKKARARSVIVLFLSGGPSQLDTFDLKPD